MVRMKVQFCLFVFLLIVSCLMGQEEENSLKQNALASMEHVQSVDMQSLLDQIASLSMEKDSILRENAEIKKKQNQLEKNIEHLTKKSSYVLELARVEEKYDLLKSESDASAATLRNKITQLESERDEAKLEITRIRERQPIVGESTDIKTLQNKIRAHEETIARHQATNERLTQTVADLEKRITELQSALQHISMERDQLHMDVRSAGGAVTKAQKDAHVTKDRYFSCSANITMFTLYYFDGDFLVYVASLSVFHCNWQYKNTTVTPPLFLNLHNCITSTTGTSRQLSDWTSSLPPSRSWSCTTTSAAPTLLSWRPASPPCSANC